VDGSRVAGEVLMDRDFSIIFFSFVFHLLFNTFHILISNIVVRYFFIFYFSLLYIALGS